MFKELLKDDVVLGVEKLKQNVSFLNKVVADLFSTFDVMVVEEKRRGQYSMAIEVGKQGNYHARRSNLVFEMKDGEIVVETVLWYHSLPSIGFKEICVTGTGYTTQKLKPVTPIKFNLTMYPDSACGNSYAVSFKLSREDVDLKDKLKFIILLLTLNNFTVKL